MSGPVRSAQFGKMLRGLHLSGFISGFGLKQRSSAPQAFLPRSRATDWRNYGSPHLSPARNQHGIINKVVYCAQEFMAHPEKHN